MEASIPTQEEQQIQIFPETKDKLPTFVKKGIRILLATGLTLGVAAIHESTGLNNDIAGASAIDDYPNPERSMPCLSGNQRDTSSSYGKTDGVGYWCEGYKWGDLTTKNENSSRGYGYRNCTDWAAWRAPKVSGVAVPNNWGDASNWDNSAKRGGYTVDKTPEVGDIAEWESPAPYGHVEVVESVNSDGSVNTSEYNQGKDGKFGTESSVRADNYIDLNGTGKVLNGVANQSHYQSFAADFNNDKVADIGLRDAGTGTFYIKHGTGFNDQVQYNWAAGANFQPYAADFNKDGLADIGLRDSNTGIFYIKHGPNFNDQVQYNWAAGANFQPYATDFNGDGYADIGLRDANTGKFYIKHGTGFNDQIEYSWAAGSNYVPFVADFNNDSLADVGLRDINTGTFYIKHGTGFNDQIQYNWAPGANFQPYANDFNGDGYADIGLRDTNNGKFYVKHGTGFSDQIEYSWATG